ncbi:MAG: PASTA domain-containing protein [bacterium]|nr:PASTA domain-containing protein [bacterium]
MVDVLGRGLDQARSALEAEGFTVEVVETRSPRRVIPTGGLRVVRQQQPADRLVRLVVTHERFAPAPRPPGG